MVNKFKLKRKWDNCKILWSMFRILLKYDLRFCQLLSILRLDSDNFYEEPDKTLRRIRDYNFKVKK